MFLHIWRTLYAIFWLTSRVWINHALGILHVEAEIFHLFRETLPRGARSWFKFQCILYFRCISWKLRLSWKNHLLQATVKLKLRENFSRLKQSGIRLAEFFMQFKSMWCRFELRIKCSHTILERMQWDVCWLNFKKNQSICCLLKYWQVLNFTHFHGRIITKYGIQRCWVMVMSQRLATGMIPDRRHISTTQFC